MAQDIPGFCTFLEWEQIWGTFSSLGALAESVRYILSYLLQFYSQLVVLPHRIPTIESKLHIKGYVSH
jgi:hypothetical protein